MFLGIDGSGWSQLWSGIFGALIGAGASVAVAFIVASRTNAHQASIASKQLRQAAEQARAALDEQEKAAKAELDALHLQLREQRRESSNERFIVAAADLLSTINRRIFVDRVADEFDFAAMTNTSVFKLRIELRRHPMSAELNEWWYLLTSLDVDERVARNSSLRTECLDRMRDARFTLEYGLIEWTSLKVAEQLDTLRHLKRARERITTERDEYLALTNRS